MVLSKGFFLIGGLISLVLGIIGIVVPVLPTVPFILLATYCFARSSKKLHHWLTTHPWFAESLLDWQTKRALAKSLKRKALIMTTLSFAISIMIVPLVWVKVFLACMWLGLIIFLWQIPELED